MMQQQQQQPPPPPQHPPPQQPAGGGGGGDFYRGPLQPPMRQLSAASSTNIPPDYAVHTGPQQHQQQQQQQQPFDAYGDNFGAKRMRKPVQRRTVDYTSSLVRYAQTRMWQRDARDRYTLQPTAAAVLDMLPSVAYPDNPSTSFASKFVHSSINKNRCSINCVLVVWVTNVGLLHVSSFSNVLGFQSKKNLRTSILSECVRI